MTTTAPQERRTYDVPTFARMLGVSRGFAYAEVASKGEIAGVRIIRVGSRILIPKRAADLALSGEPASAGE